MTAMGRDLPFAEDLSSVCRERLSGGVAARRSRRHGNRPSHDCSSGGMPYSLARAPARVLVPP
jgi:hypothetical protein